MMMRIDLRRAAILAVLNAARQRLAALKGGATFFKGAAAVGCLLTSLLAGASPLHAQGTRKDDIVLGPRGTPVAGATVAVCTQPANTSTKPCTPLANLYSNSALTLPIANPITADGLGNYHFYAAPGKYTLQISGSQLTTTVIPDVILPNDPMNPTVTTVTTTGAISALSMALSGNLTVGGSVSVTGTLLAPNVAGKPSTADSICYVSAAGNDLNDGLSWGTAKLTIMACYDALPLAGGTIYNTNGVAATSTAGQGIWIMGPGDPNFASPPVGWRKAKSGAVNFIGNAGVTLGTNSNFGGRTSIVCGSAADLNHPCVWISATNSTMNFSNHNYAFPGRAALLGVCSDNSTITCNTSGISFFNDNFAVADVPGNGPTITITSSSALWINFYYSGCQGTDDQNTPANDNAQCVLIDGRGNAGANLISFFHFNTQLGGIKVYPGSSSGGIFVDTMTCESLFGGACVWFTSTSSAQFSHLRDVSSADLALNSTAYNVQVDGNGPAGSVECDGCAMGIVPNGTGFGGNIGPMIAPAATSQLLSNSTVSPTRMSQSGFMSGSQVGIPARVIGRVDDARSLGAPAAVPYANLASQLPSAWGTRGAGNITIAGGKLFDRDGTTNAGRVTSSSGAAFAYFADINQTYAAGDILIYGAWYRSVTANGYQGGSPIGQNALGSCATFTDISGQGVTSAGSSQFPFISGDGQWEWGYRVLKTTTVPTNPCETVFFGDANTTQTAEFYAPILLHIPAGQISDNEAAELALNLGNWPDTAPVGSVAMLRGHDFLVGQHLTAFASNSDLAGRITITAATNASLTFAKAFSSAPVCVASPTSNPGAATWWVSTSTTAVTVNLSASSTITFNYVCAGDPN